MSDEMSSKSLTPLTGADENLVNRTNDSNGEHQISENSNLNVHGNNFTGNELKRDSDIEAHKDITNNYTGNDETCKDDEENNTNSKLRKSDDQNIPIFNVVDQDDKFENILSEKSELPDNSATISSSGEEKSSLKSTSKDDLNVKMDSEKGTCYDNLSFVHSPKLVENNPSFSNETITSKDVDKDSLNNGNLEEHGGTLEKIKSNEDSDCENASNLRRKKSTADREKEPNLEESNSKFDWKPYVYQLQLVLLVTIGLFASGSILAFPSVIISDLQQHHTNIYGDVISFTDTEKDLLGSVASMGAIVGVLICAPAVAHFGRKWVLTILGLVAVVSWLGVSLAPVPWVVLLFRGLSGSVYGGFNVTAMAYIVEITDEVVRSSLTLLSAGMIVTGQLVSVIPAYWLRYYFVVFIDCVPPAVFFVLTIFFLPESPTALVLRGSEAKARKVLQKVRAPGVDLDKEIQGYRDLNKLYQETNVWQALKRRDVLVRLGIVHVLFIIQVFAGYTIFVAQTARILEDSGSNVESRLATILVQLSQLVGVAIAMILVKRVGRRGSLLMSHVVMGAAVGALATFTLLYSPAGVEEDWASAGNTTEMVTGAGTYQSGAQLADYLQLSTHWIKKQMDTYETGTDEGGELSEAEGSYDWVPLACLMVAQFGCSLGIQSIPFILASEYFPTSIRPQASALCIAFANILGVISLQMYTPLQNLVGQPGLLYLNCAFSIIAIPFTYFVVQETVGKKVG